MIEIRNLYAGYSGKTVLQDVNLTFQPGKITVLIGPNGSGKSTLLKAALGLLSPDQGQILYDGVSVSELSRRQVARKAALLAQSRGAPAILTEKLVLHGRFPYLSYPRQYSREDHRIAAEAMKAVGADAFAGRLVSELSGGQRQSVYLAMLLAQQTQTVFLDEPTTYLDIRNQLGMLRWVRNLAARGNAVVLILHDLPMAMEVADEVVVLEQGRVVMQADSETVYQSGILDRVFGIRFFRSQDENGLHYFCKLMEEEQ